MMVPDIKNSEDFLKLDKYHFYDEVIDDETYDEELIEELFKNSRRSNKKKDRDYKGIEPSS